jgi:hypothetical protein
VKWVEVEVVDEVEAKDNLQLKSVGTSDNRIIFFSAHFLITGLTEFLLRQVG